MATSRRTFIRQVVALGPVAMTFWEPNAGNPIRRKIVRFPFRRRPRDSFRTSRRFFFAIRPRRWRSRA